MLNKIKKTLSLTEESLQEISYIQKELGEASISNVVRYAVRETAHNIKLNKVKQA